MCMKSSELPTSDENLKYYWVGHVISCPNFVPLTPQRSGQSMKPKGLKLLILLPVQVGLLTIYDMCKAVDRGMVMTGVRLLEKEGGKSGRWTAS
mgnify:CR=1 FL=1